MLQSVQFTQPPPPVIPNLSVPPPMPPHHFPQHRFHGDRGGHRGHYFQPFRPYPRPGPGGPDSEFDGKRLRKSVMRKTVDYNSAIIKMLECRVWQRDFRDRRALQPDVLYYPDLQPPPSYVDNPINSVTTRFVKTATNKMRCPIFCMAWTPEGRRLVTGASSGEFTLWNGLTFNFETILQAHDSPVRTMVWSHNDVWMVTGDHAGYVKYWQSNMNNVKMFQAHKEAIRGLSFSPTDHKFVTCSDDGTLRIWDFMRCHEERILRGHGADVKCCHWHPQKGLIVSGSKDNQQPVKLWDPKTGQSLATLHAHKSTVMDIKWNANGNWLVTASRDHLLKLFDLRNLSQEVQTFRGHKKEASSVAWHPYHEGLFCSGGSDGAILFWHVGADKEVGGIEQAHDSIVWTLAWHPLGHILCSGSNDHTSKFWTRNRPGDLMRDKYNLNTLPAGLPGIDDQDIDEPAVIPGMGPEDKVETVANQATAQIPGLDFEGVEDRQKPFHKKVPYSKPIPRNFQAQWNETGRVNHEDGRGNPTLAQAIADGPEALNRLINSGEIEELQDVMPFIDDGEYEYNEDDMDLETMSDIELPAPLPSSAFAKKNSDTPGNSGTVPGERVRKSRFSDLPDSASAQPPRLEHNNADRQNTVVLKPMDNVTPSKSVGDEDMRMLQMKAPGFPAPDQDMRFVQGDIDLRQPPRVSVPLTGDQDFRRIQTDSDLRQVGGDSRFPLDEDLRLGSVDQDLRSVPGPLQPMPMGSVPFGSDSDFRQSSGIPPLLPRPSQLSPSGRTRDVDGRSPHFGPGGPQFSGRQRGLLPLMEMDSWSGPRKRRWGDADHDDDEEEQLSGQGNPGHFGRPGAFGSTRTGGGGSFGPPGRDFVSGRGSPGGNFGPGRGLSPSTNFGPDRGNFSDIRGGGPDGMYGHLSGDDSYGPPEEIDNMRGNFGHGLLRGGSFGPDGDRGDGYPSEDELDNEDMDSFGQGNGHDWSGSFSGHGRGSYQGQYPYSMDPGYPKRGSGGRGFTRGRSSFSRGGMRSGQRGRFPTGRGRGGRGSQKHSKERGKF